MADLERREESSGTDSGSRRWGLQAGPLGSIGSENHSRSKRLDPHRNRPPLGCDRDLVHSMSAASSLDHSRLIERLAGRLRWRDAINGVSSGQGRGSRSAASGEFDNHARWCPGDDLHRLDLRVWLRLRQRWTRSYRDDSSEPLTIIIDGGASMGFGDKPQAVSWTCELFLAVARARRDPHRLWILDWPFRAIAQQWRPEEISVAPCSEWNRPVRDQEEW